jgi:hypothetical protein
VDYRLSSYTSDDLFEGDAVTKLVFSIFHQAFIQTPLAPEIRAKRLFTPIVRRILMLIRNLETTMTLDSGCQGYVEDFDEMRTKLGACFSSLPQKKAIDA